MKNVKKSKPIKSRISYFTIRENSFVARLAAKKLKARQVAMVLGHTIHLYGISKTVFLTRPHWLRHELKHIEQFQRYGFLRFLVKYIGQSLQYGYYNAPLEKEARAAENDPELLARFTLRDPKTGRT